MTRAQITIFLHAPDAYAFNSFTQTAGYWCGYWASSMETHPGNWNADQTRRTPYCLITAAPEDSPDEQVYRVTPQRVAEAVLELFIAGDSGIGIRNIVRLRSFYESEDCCVIDCADEADRILQQACFGKIVYG